MRIGILGHFAEGQDYCDGQTVKTRTLYFALSDELGLENISIVDTYNWKRHPFRLYFKILSLLKRKEYIFLLPAHNGIRIYIPLILELNKRYKRKLFYVVIGGWLPEIIEKNKKLAFKLKKLDGIFVETSKMKTRLIEKGFNNVDIVTNFKQLKLLNQSEIKEYKEKPFRFCIFSRVMVEKGITDAIMVLNSINKEYGYIIATLDIYGKIDETYYEEFNILRITYNNFVDYKGIINYNDSVEVLKNYYMLMFPTKFYTEGVPGTIIDAFASGLPILSSEWENYNTILSEKLGIAYNFNDIKDFKKKTIYAIENPDVINGLRLNCLNKARDYISENVIKQLTEIITRK